jgi:hypothetical protein
MSIDSRMLATDGLLDTRFTVTPAHGAEAPISRNSTWLWPGVMSTVDFCHITVVPTSTSPLAELYPGAEAVMLTGPTLIPDTCGWITGCVCPSAMKTVGGMNALPGSALVKVTVTPPNPAGEGSRTGNGVDLSIATVVNAGTMIALTETTDTFAVTAAILVPDAVITADPGDTPVTATLAVVAPVANVTAGGTDATPVALDDRLIVRPACAGPLKMTVRVWVVVPAIVTLAGLKVNAYPTTMLAFALGSPVPQYSEMFDLY